MWSKAELNRRWRFLLRTIQCFAYELSSMELTPMSLQSEIEKQKNHQVAA